MSQTKKRKLQKQADSIACNDQGLLAVVVFERLLFGKLGEDNQGYWLNTNCPATIAANPLLVFVFFCAAELL